MFSDWVVLAPFEGHARRSFLLRHSFEGEGYEVQFSDLQSIWVERLDRKGVIHRSLTEDTPIDASEDRQQRERLLDYVKAALESKDPRRVRLTSLTTDTAQLEAISNLPEATKLPPVRWPLTLTLPTDPTTTVANEIMGPLLSTSFVQKQQIESLVRLLQEKDAAIGKLLEKFESAGVDLATVFPNAGAARKGRLTRAQVLHLVRGLGAFDRESWKKETLPPNHETLDPRALVEEALKAGDASSHIQSIAQLLTLTSPSVDEVPLSASTLGPSSRSVPASRSSHDMRSTLEASPLKAQASFEDDGEFQRQTTPASLQTRPDPPIPRAQTTRPVNNDDSTDDEDDLDAPYTQPSAPSAAPSQGPPQSQTTTPANDAPVTSSTKQHPRAPSPSLDDTTMDLDESPPAPEPAPSRPKGKLGALSSRRKVASPPPEPEVLVPASAPQPAESTEQPTQAASAPRGRLGKLGRKAAPPSTLVPSSAEHAVSPVDVAEHAPAAAATPRKRTKSPEPSSPIKRETSEERAERRRIELERELDAKRRAPAKKKRRF